MLNQKEITLHGEQFLLQTLPASKGIEAAVVFSHIMAGAADGVGETRGDFYDTPLNFGAMAAGIFKRLDSEGTPAFIKGIICQSVIDPPLDGELYEIKFAGKFDLMCDLVVAILEHNNLIDFLKKKRSQIWKNLSG